MTVNTRNTIIKTSKKLFAVNGYEGFSMRTLAAESGVGLSSIYHFFKDKDEILKYIFDSTNIDLGIKRASLPKAESAESMLLDRINFQFANIEDVIFVLKYYLHFRSKFLKLDSGYFPEKGYLHIKEVLDRGLENGEFSIKSDEINKVSKVVAHAINGFLIEYYPNPPKAAELVDVTDSIHKFLMQSLTNKEVKMM